MKGWTKFQIRVSARCCNTGKSRLSKICRLVPFSEVKNIKMYPLFGGQHSEHVVIIYFFRGRDICDTQSRSKSGNIQLFYVLARLRKKSTEADPKACFGHGVRFPDLIFFNPFLLSKK